MIFVLACEIFKPELDYLNLDSAVYQVHYLPIRAHNNSADLRRRLQEQIDGAEGKYQAILLAYGLCGNAAAGLRAKTVPLFIPKTHDCSHILLGGTEHSRCFSETPSRGWVTRGNIDASEPGLTFGSDMMSYTLESLQKEYGDEEGEYIWSTLHQSDSDTLVYYIRVPQTARPTDQAEAEKYAQKHGKTLQTLEGTLDILEKLVKIGPEVPEILHVKPGEEIRNTWDETVMTAGPAGNP